MSRLYEGQLDALDRQLEPIACVHELLDLKGRHEKCTRSATWIGRTICPAGGHVCVDLLCDEHHDTVEAQASWFRCDTCGFTCPVAPITWSRL